MSLCTSSPLNSSQNIITLPTYRVLNRKVKGANRNVAEARKAAVEKRQKTIGVEYKNRDKVNSFVDKRFGEDDENLTNEEKMLMRFAKQVRKGIRGIHSVAILIMMCKRPSLTITVLLITLRTYCRGPRQLRRRGCSICLRGGRN
jgi:hypothetical protein